MHTHTKVCGVGSRSPGRFQLYPAGGGSAVQKLISRTQFEGGAHTTKNSRFSVCVCDGGPGDQTQGLTRLHGLSLKPPFLIQQRNLRTHLPQRHHQQAFPSSAQPKISLPHTPQSPGPAQSLTLRPVPTLTQQMSCLPIGFGFLQINENVIMLSCSSLQNRTFSRSKP